MTDVQRRATAAGFLHVLHTSPEVFNEWNPIKKDDYAALGKLIQKTVGLHETPSTEDIHGMASYIDAHLKDEAEKFHQAHADAPRHVGSVAYMQQS
ncbi:MAG TPA: hypothetical protein VK702_05450 [Candidatus Acidoferrum sp.]|jgi:hypothetical protein|nr:hypothetical protein [Candidatus Acidoferrum sp.]